jgi:hypothetical protein
MVGIMEGSQPEAVARGSAGCRSRAHARMGSSRKKVG